MNTVFDPISKRNFRAKNRLVRSATWMAQADSDGRPNDRCVETYRKLSEGGVGTIITEGVYIYSYPGDEQDHAFRMTDDRWIADYRRIADAIHSSGALAIMQILYLQCKRKNIFNEWKPCAVDNMTDEEIKTVIRAHVDAAVRARKAGFDGVEIHAAHGFLLSQFLSGGYNHRSDRYGRDRKRLVMDIYRKIRRATSPGFAIWIKINSTDYVPDGMTQEECVRDATFFSDRGMDVIEISANEPSHPKVRIGVDESYFQNTAAMLKKMAAAPVILTGGNRTVQTMNDLMNRYGIDAFGMSRPLISEPDLPEKWMKSRTRMKTPRCISCNACFRTKYHQCVLR